MNASWRLSARYFRLRRLLRAAPLVLGIILSRPLPSYAQAARLNTWVGGQFPTSQWQHPTVGEGGRINCAPGTDGCVPLNLAACDEAATPRPIGFSVNPGASSNRANYTGSGQIVYAFLSTSPSCVYSTQVGGQNNNPNFLIGTSPSVSSSSVFFGGTVPFGFPTGAASSLTLEPSLTGTVPGQLTTRDVLRAFGVCPNLGGVAVQLQTYYICVGLDADATGGVNNTAAAATTTTAVSTSTSTSSTAGAATGADPFEYIQFMIDTQPPEAPDNFALVSLDNRVQATAHFTSTDLDIQVLRILATQDAVNFLSSETTDANGNVQAADCRSWKGDVQHYDSSVQGQAQGEVSTIVHGVNGLPVAVCALSVDYLGNQSVPTAIKMEMPHAESDLFEVYPDELTTGFCSAGLPAGYWALGLSAALYRMVRSRRAAAHERWCR